MLALGFVTKKRWLKILSTIPLTIFIIQLVMLMGIGRLMLIKWLIKKR